MKNYYLISSGVLFGLSVATFNSNTVLKSIASEEKKAELDLAVAKNNQNSGILLAGSVLIAVFAIFGMKK